MSATETVAPVNVDQTETAPPPPKEAHIYRAVEYPIALCGALAGDGTPQRFTGIPANACKFCAFEAWLRGAR